MTATCPGPQCRIDLAAVRARILKASETSFPHGMTPDVCITKFSMSEGCAYWLNAKGQWRFTENVSHLAESDHWLTLAGVTHEEYAALGTRTLIETKIMEATGVLRLVAYISRPHDEQGNPLEDEPYRWDLAIQTAGPATKEQGEALDRVIKALPQDKKVWVEYDRDGLLNGRWSLSSWEGEVRSAADIAPLYSP